MKLTNQISLAITVGFQITSITFGSIVVPTSSGWGVVIPRGGSDEVVDSAYSNQLEAVKSACIEKATEAIEDLKSSLDQGTMIESLGSKADRICNQALEQFSTTAPPSTTDADGLLYDKKLTELEAALDAPLHVLYFRQLNLIRERSLQQFREATTLARRGGGGAPPSDYEAMLQADSYFLQHAQEATRQEGDWDFTSERHYLQTILSEWAAESKKGLQIQLKGAQQHQTAMQFLQSQQQMIGQLQMQLYGQSSPWNIGLAYRIPDTNFNLQGSYQQGRANLQLSCVPDEYAPLLGANGFTNGVGPGNLGLSLNLSL